MSIVGLELGDVPGVWELSCVGQEEQPMEFMASLPFQLQFNHETNRPANLVLNG